MNVRTAPQLAPDVTHPATLLAHAWELEPWGRYDERGATLDRLEQCLASGLVPPPPPDRDWELELIAERAVDATRLDPNDRALVDQVLDATDPDNPAHWIARGRALLAGGTALAWTGTDPSVIDARREYEEAAAIFARLGRPDWQGSALLRNGYHAHYQAGDLIGAEQLIGQALATYPPGQRRDGSLTFYADVLIELGAFDRAEAILLEAAEAAERNDDARSRPEVLWGRARVAAGREDSAATERLLREAERLGPAAEWFETHIGGYFFAEAAWLLDRVGLTRQAHAYLEKAIEHIGRHHSGPDDPVIETRAFLMARSGDPGEALDALQAIVRVDFIHKRELWRHQLMTAWATFRLGRSGAGELAQAAFDTAAALGGGDLRVALAGEPGLTAALAPLAEASGSEVARDWLLDGRRVLIRLFGTPSVTDADGKAVELPTGKPAELVRMLALHPDGLPIEQVLEHFFPDAEPSAGRHRLRQILMRLRSAAGDLVVRGEEFLRLAPAWIDTVEFVRAAERVRGARGARALQFAYAALALRSGPPVPGDAYAGWAEARIEELDYRYLEVLDLVTADARARASHQEALTALEEALAADPDDARRQQAIVEELRALGRPRAAEHRARQRPD